jgi:hypothetical protein
MRAFGATKLSERFDMSGLAELIMFASPLQPSSCPFYRTISILFLYFIQCACSPAILMFSFRSNVLGAILLSEVCGLFGSPFFAIFPDYRPAMLASRL